MCIIAMIPTKAQRPGEDVIANCWTSNPDGGGLMYPDATRGILVVDKGHMTLEAMQKAFLCVPEGVPVCLHFRIKTHGNLDAANTHPHVVIPDETAICHNGILPISVPTNSPESDTARFARLVLASLPTMWFKNPGLVHLVQEYMGRGNKIVAMSREGQYTIINEEQGQWEGGTWYSNGGFRRSLISYSYHGQSAWDDDAYTYPLAGGAAHQTRTQTGSQVAAPASQSHGGPTPDVTGRESMDDLVKDPLVRFLSSPLADVSDLELMTKDIGSMTDEEFARYEEITEACYGPFEGADVRGAP